MSLNSERPTEDPNMPPPYANRPACLEGCATNCQLKNQAATINNFTDLTQKAEVISAIRKNKTFQLCPSFENIDPKLELLQARILKNIREEAPSAQPKGSQRLKRTS